MAISVGVFLVLTIGAAILVFTPKKTNLPFETVSDYSNSGTNSVTSLSPYQSPIAVSEQQPSSVDAVDLVRNPGGLPGLVTLPEGVNSQDNWIGRSAESVISVNQPTTAAVPSTPPAGRAANQSTPTTTRPAQTTTTPAQTSTTPAQTTTTPPQTTSTPAQTTSSPAQTTSRPAQTASTPAQTTTTPAQTASRPAQTTAAPTASTGSQSSPAAQTRAYDDFWVQTGAFSTIASAEGVKETLASKGITSIIENGIINGRTLFRVRVGPYTSRNEANYWLALIKSIDGFEDSQVRQAENLR